MDVSESGRARPKPGAAAEPTPRDDPYSVALAWHTVCIPSIRRRCDRKREGVVSSRLAVGNERAMGDGSQLRTGN